MTRHALPLLLFCLTACAAGEPESTAAIIGDVRSADGVRIRYDVRGSGDPAIVLVHGWMNTRGIWGEHPDNLASTHRVVTLDLAGHGESGMDRRDWTMAAFGEDVAAVVEKLSLDRVVLVGFSMGGAAVLEAPAPLGDRVLGIVLVDVFHDPDVVPSEEQVAQLEAAFRANWGDTAFVRSFAFTPDAPEPLIEYVTEMLPHEPEEYLFRILRSYANWGAHGLKPALRRANMPIAAINTAHPPTNIEAMRRYVPSFEATIVSGVGHAGILLQQIDEFDRRLLADVDRFAAAAPISAPN